MSQCPAATPSCLTSRAISGEAETANSLKMLMIDPSFLFQRKLGSFPFRILVETLPGAGHEAPQPCRQLTHRPALLVSDAQSRFGHWVLRTHHGRR